MASADELATWKELAVELAQASGEIVRKHFRANPAVETKSDGTPVSVADREAERVVREILGQRVPKHGIHGEEFGHSRPEASLRWVIDPIDGTKSFLAGGFDFGTLIALMEDGEPILGVIHQPVLGELFLGDNESTTRNGQLVRASACEELADAVLLLTDFQDVARFQDRARFERLTRSVKFARTWGNCFAYTLVASGFAQIALDPIMSDYDIMALVPVVRGAGAIITDYHGGDPVRGTSTVAAVPQLHRQVIEILNG